MAKADAPTLLFDTVDDWQSWLADNHDSSPPEPRVLQIGDR
ncbi:MULTISPECIES: hypothetical protein [Gordonia]|nr:MULTISPECIES: hypothetical protein [Gordonia]